MMRKSPTTSTSTFLHKPKDGMVADETSPIPPQRAETSRSKACDDHLMPGLISQIVDTFQTPRKHLTTRGVARRKRIPEALVTTALIRDLYQEVEDLRRLLGMKRAA